MCTRGAVGQASSASDLPDGAVSRAAGVVRRLAAMVVCAHCGVENPDGFRFCGGCGSPLAAASVAERRERRVVSVLFADLVGFTRRSEHLDVEDVEGFLAPYQALLAGCVERTGGVVAKFTGDGVMAAVRRGRRARG